MSVNRVSLKSGKKSLCKKGFSYTLNEIIWIKSGEDFMLVNRVISEMGKNKTIQKRP